MTVPFLIYIIPLAVLLGGTIASVGWLPWYFAILGVIAAILAAAFVLIVLLAEVMR